MKKSILKLLSLIGVYLIVFCASAGSVADATVNNTHKLGGVINTTPIIVTAKGSGRSEWLRSAYSAHAKAPSATPASSEVSFRSILTAAEEASYEYSEEEKAYIARVVYAEARGEAFEGQVAVAAVVLNRFESGRFGKTVKRVVFARHQFAVSRKYNDESMAAVEAAIEQRGEFPEDMYYFQVSKRKRWRNFEYYDRIGNHSFYCAR